MNPQQLRYDEETATRYSAPPSFVKLDADLDHLATHYLALLALRDKAKQHHATLVKAGIFESVPTLTVEKKSGRPGNYWRALFPKNSPEVRHGNPRKHYIGNSEVKLQTWRDWILRTQLAMKLSQLVDDIGNTLRHDCRTIAHSATMIEAALANYTLHMDSLR